jgi:hypothetical protein
MRLLGATTLVFLALAGSASADVDRFTVKSDADPGDGTCTTQQFGCTLYEAMMAARDNDPSGDIDTININLGLSLDDTISLAGHLPLVDDPLEISGKAIIDAQHGVRPFSVGQFASLKLDGLTITGGKTPLGESGGGIDVGYSGSLTLRNSSITDCATDEDGGAIAASLSAALRVEGSTISGNHAGKGGGGISTGSAGLTVVRSTISQNYTTGATGQGGGILAGGNSTEIFSSTIAGNHTEGQDAHGGGLALAGNGTEIVDSTLAGNNVRSPSAKGGGIYARSDAVESAVTNSIVADNFVGLSQSSGSDLSAEEQADKFNLAFSLVEAPAGAPTAAAVAGSNVLGADPKLGALGQHGGPTATMLPAITSPVLDKGATDETTDQRGSTRPEDITKVSKSSAAGADNADMGAAELTAAESVGAADPSVGGGSAKPGPGPGRRAVPFGISSLRLSPARFTAKRGTSVSFAATAGGRVTFRVARRTTRRKRTKVRVLGGTITRAAHAGKNRFHLSGRLRGRRLRPGAYELRAVVAGRTVNKVRFRIVTPS